MTCRELVDFRDGVPGTLVRAIVAARDGRR